MFVQHYRPDGACLELDNECKFTREQEARKIWNQNNNKGEHLLPDFTVHCEDQVPVRDGQTRQAVCTDLVSKQGRISNSWGKEAQLNSGDWGCGSTTWRMTW